MPRRMPQFAQGVLVFLPRPAGGHPKFLADLFEREAVCIPQLQHGHHARREAAGHQRGGAAVQPRSFELGALFSFADVGLEKISDCGFTIYDLPPPGKIFWKGFLVSCVEVPAKIWQRRNPGEFIHLMLVEKINCQNHGGGKQNHNDGFPGEKFFHDFNSLT